MRDSGGPITLLQSPEDFPMFKRRTWSTSGVNLQLMKTEWLIITEKERVMSPAVLLCQCSLSCHIKLTSMFYKSHPSSFYLFYLITLKTFPERERRNRHWDCFLGLKIWGKGGGGHSALDSWLLSFVSISVVLGNTCWDSSLNCKSSVWETRGRRCYRSLFAQEKTSKSDFFPHKKKSVWPQKDGKSLFFSGPPTKKRLALSAVN